MELGDVDIVAHSYFVDSVIVFEVERLNLEFVAGL